MDNSGVVHILKCQKTDDLHSVYNLLSRVPDGLQTMASCISTHLCKELEALMNAIKSSRGERGHSGRNSL